MISGVVAVVPLMQDDRDAPRGCAGLRELQGRSLLGWVVDGLARSGHVGRVVVPVPEAVGRAVVDEVLVDVVPIDVVPVSADDANGRLLAVLGCDPAGIVVVHDPLHPLSPASLLPAVLEALADAPDVAGAVPLGPVTDTLKRVDEDDVVTGTLDREGYRTVHVPQAYRTAAVRAALSGAEPDELRRSGVQVLPELVRRAGGRLVAVPAPAEAVRIVGDDDLVLAEALIHGSRRGPGPGGEVPDRC